MIDEICATLGEIIGIIILIAIIYMIYEYIKSKRIEKN